MTTEKDRNTLRELATQYRELCDSEGNVRTLQRWRDLNNMKGDGPMVCTNCNLLAAEIATEFPRCEIEDKNLRGAVSWFHRQLWDASVGDDRAFFPWFTVRSGMFQHPEGIWGVEPNRVRDESSRGWRHFPVLKTMADLDRLKATEHRVLDPMPDRAKRLEDIFGDILPVHVKRSTIYPVWGGTDLSEAAGAMFGLEELMYALCMEPEMVHRFMAFTRDAVLENLKQGEAAGDWSTADSWYYMTPALCDDLPDAAPNTHGAKLKDLAWFTHAQEFEGTSPKMHEEFLLNYQLPILELFGRVTYGCCETLDTKLDILDQIPNMTKVLSGPCSDPAYYPEKVGDRCVISWRPVASNVASEHFDEDVQRQQLREGLAKLKGCQIEVHMHEPMTVQNDPSRIRTWTRIAREEIEKAW